MESELSGIADPVYTRVREKIRQDIFGGHYAPGARLTTADLQKRYGVSQMPIREALQQLQGEGLVVIAPNRGATVRRLDAAFVNNLYDIRAALEGMLVRRAVGAAGENDIAALRQAQGRFEERARQRNVEGALAANRELHESINRLAGNPEALAVIARHSDLLQSLRRRFGYGVHRMREIVSEHRQLLRAFERKDTAAAVRIVEEHCENARRDLIEQAGFGSGEAARP